MQLSSRTALQLISACVMAFLALTACTSSPPVKPESPAERMERDNAVGLEFSLKLEKAVKFKHDKEVQSYLRGLARKLADSTPELRDASVGVWVVRDERAKWNSFSIPGNRVYLSAGLLKTIEFENELAALIAIELGHLVRRHMVERLGVTSSPKSLGFFGPSGVFNYPESSQKEALETAVQILYAAGFDPRGLVSLLGHYERNPEHSPYEGAALERLQEYSRTVIAQNAPLLNPIVRSAAFVAIQKRMQKL